MNFMSWNRNEKPCDECDAQLCVLCLPLTFFFSVRSSVLGSQLIR